MKEKIIYSLDYTPLTQQKYCCLPCCIQWVMLRRGIKLISQDEMARDLGIVIAPEDQRLFNVKQQTKKGSIYGTLTYKIPQFLKKHKISLTVKRYYPSKIENIEQFITNNLQAGNDIIVSFNMAAYAKPESGVNYGHSCLVCAIRSAKNETIITLGDPAYTHRKFFDIKLSALLDGMSTKYGKEKSFKVFNNKI